MKLIDAHLQVRVTNDDAMRLGCEPPLRVESFGDEHTIELDCARYVRYERARYRRALTTGEDPFDE